MTLPLLSLSKNGWVVVAVDHLARFAVTAVLPIGSSAEIAIFFIKDVLLKHGASQVLFGDRGWPFLAQLLQDIL